MDWVINAIRGGLTAKGESSTRRKAYVQQVHNISSEFKRPRTSKCIIFSDENLRGQNPYDGVVTILAVIPNIEV